jgi:DeoR/GlpR family transcriptional regulator of sugar metabolism
VNGAIYRMLVAERYKKILEVVNQRGSVRVSELSEMFNVTEETIRRDLGNLEKEGKLLRSHGGAISIEGQKEVPFTQREITNVEEKRAIASKALEFIKQGDTIILDASSTAWYIARIIPDIPLTVITNSVRVVQELSGKEQIQVISTGGVLTQKSMSFIGPNAERNLDLYHADKVFISCKGVHENGLSESSIHQAAVKNKMIDISEKVFLLVDYSKINERSLTFLTSLDQIDILITDNKADASFLNLVMEKGIRTYTA